MLAQRSFDQLNEMMEAIAQAYFVAVKLHRYNSEHCLKENEYSKDQAYDVYIFKVLEAFEKLNEKDKSIINNEFFFQSYEDWWTSLYSEQSFLESKKSALVSFLGAFYYE